MRPLVKGVGGHLKPMAVAERQILNAARDAAHQSRTQIWCGSLIHSKTIQKDWYAVTFMKPLAGGVGGRTKVWVGRQILNVARDAVPANLV